MSVANTFLSDEKQSKVNIKWAFCILTERMLQCCILKIGLGRNFTKMELNLANGSAIKFLLHMH